ncbi:RNA methyltransferase [Candidatus Woesearchaeota archaeon]|nr:RNA methyltransferase [Candidatus Woesearchaeota archaeon]
MISIILVEPENSGNIGAVARAMKNFGFSDLVILNPKCDPLCEEARKRAKWANDVLRRAKIRKRIPRNFDYLVGTTARLGTDYNIPRSPLTPEQLAEKISNRKIGILFGRESTGLRNNEIELCDFTVTIPTKKAYSSLNLSHSVAIVLYELSKDNIELSKFPAISKKEKEVLYTYIIKSIDRMKFSTQEKKKTQKIIWKKVMGKAMLTKREAFALMGFFRKLE